MAATEKKGLIVELYDLSITARKDDRFGRVVTSKSLNEDDLIKIAVERRTDLNPATLRASLDILKDVLLEEICNGAAVSFGLAHYGLQVSGSFKGDNAVWDRKEHAIEVKITPNGTLRTAIDNLRVNVRGMAPVGTIINTVLDVTTSLENSRLTPGGGINIVGSKIRVEGDDPAVGLKLVKLADGTEVVFAKEAILENKPSSLTVIVPATLTAGDYKLVITTQCSGTQTLLKEPRTYEFEHVLTVI